MLQLLTFGDCDPDCSALPPIRPTGIAPAAHLYLVIVTGSFSSSADSSNWNHSSCSPLPGDCNPDCLAPPPMNSSNWSPYRRTFHALILCPTLGAIVGMVIATVVRVKSKSQKPLLFTNWYLYRFISCPRAQACSVIS